MTEQTSSEWKSRIFAFIGMLEGQTDWNIDEATYGASLCGEHSCQYRMEAKLLD